MKERIATIEGLIKGLLTGDETGPNVDVAIGGLRTAVDNLRWHMARAAVPVVAELPTEVGVPKAEAK